MKKPVSHQNSPDTLRGQCAGNCAADPRAWQTSLSVRREEWSKGFSHPWHQEIRDASIWTFWPLPI